MEQTFTILINSSDNFEDCWQPFFYLFNKNWIEDKSKIILNTEFKTFYFEGLNINCTKVHVGIVDRKLTWSECFIKALEQIDTELVLYFQEDYFIDKPINVDFIQLQATRMLQSPTIRRIGLTTNDYKGALHKTEYTELWEAGNTAQYKVCTQAALWRKDALLSYLEPKESGWMFEIFGTWRSRKRKGERFLTLNRDIYNLDNQITSYLHTGIIKGKWHPDIPKIFEANDINTDFTVRGFYNLHISKTKSRVLLFKKLMTEPLLFIKALLNLI